MMTGAALGQVVNAAAYPALARLYSPEDLGNFAVYVSVLLIVTVAASLRLEAAIPLTEDNELKPVVSVCFLLVSAVAALAAVILVLERLLVDRLFSDALSSLVLFLPVGILVAGWYQILAALALRQQAYSPIASSRVTQMVTTSLAQILLAMVLGGPVMLVAGDIGGRVAAASALARGWRGAPSCRPVVARRAVLRRYRRFPQLAFPAAFLGILTLQVPALAIAVAYGAREAGLFALAQRVLTIPVQLIGQSSSQAFTAETAARVRGGESETLRQLAIRTVWKFAIVSVPLAVAVAIASPTAFTVVFGDDWAVSGHLARALSLALAGQLVVFAVLPYFNILERQDLQLMWDAGRALLVGGSWTAAILFDMQLGDAVLSYSLAAFVSYLWFVRLLMGSPGDNEPTISAAADSGSMRPVARATGVAK